MADHTSRPSLDRIQIQRRLNEVGELITRVEAVDIETVVQVSPAVTALQAGIRETLIQCFGENTPSYRIFHNAGYLHASGDLRGANRKVIEDWREEAQANIKRVLNLLREVQLVLRGDLAEAEQRLQSAERSGSPSGPLSRRVFVVHGHDDGARETVARFLEQIDFEPIILHEQANQGRTIIEKFEAHGNVGFAVVLLTPDDEGCAKDGDLQPRARQNVVLELGYFIGRLGRNKVCALKRGDLELPSDYQGVLWETMDSGGGWKQKLARELKAAGHVIDGNKVMDA